MGAPAAAPRARVYNTKINHRCTTTKLHHQVLGIFHFTGSHVAQRIHDFVIDKLKRFGLGKTNLFIVHDEGSNMVAASKISAQEAMEGDGDKPTCSWTSIICKNHLMQTVVNNSLPEIYYESQAFKLQKGAFLTYIGDIIRFTHRPKIQEIWKRVCVR
eukprot:tig00001301_g8081.t1